MHSLTLPCPRGRIRLRAINVPGGRGAWRRIETSCGCRSADKFQTQAPVPGETDVRCTSELWLNPVEPAVVFGYVSPPPHGSQHWRAPMANVVVNRVPCFARRTAATCTARRWPTRPKGRTECRCPRSAYNTKCNCYASSWTSRRIRRRPRRPKCTCSGTSWRPRAPPEWRLRWVKRFLSCTGVVIWRFFVRVTCRWTPKRVADIFRKNRLPCLADAILQR